MRFFISNFYIFAQMSFCLGKCLEWTLWPLNNDEYNNLYDTSMLTHAGITSWIISISRKECIMDLLISLIIVFIVNVSWNAIILWKYLFPFSRADTAQSKGCAQDARCSEHGVIFSAHTITTSAWEVEVFMLVATATIWASA